MNAGSSFRATFEGFAFGRDLGKQMFNLKTKFDMENESSINHCTPPDAKQLLAAAAVNLVEN